MKVPLILPVTIRTRFSLLQTIQDIKFGIVRMFVTPYHLLDNINITFGNKLYRQIVGIPMGTNCAHRAADLFLFKDLNHNFEVISSDEKH